MLIFPLSLVAIGTVTAVRARDGIAAAETTVLWYVKKNSHFEGDPQMEAYQSHSPHNFRLLLWPYCCAPTGKEPPATNP